MRHYPTKHIPQGVCVNLPASRPAIAFLGTGLMGRPMAARLLQAGYPLTAWNRTRAKAEALAAFGAQVAATAADAVREAEIVITMLEAGPIVAEVVAGVLTHLRPGALWIDMSSTRPAEAQQLHATLAARGVAFVDAPVSGGVLGAE